MAKQNTRQQNGPLCTLEDGEYKAGDVVILFVLLCYPQSQKLIATSVCAMEMHSGGPYLSPCTLTILVSKYLQGQQVLFFTGSDMSIRLARSWPNRRGI